jgi:hypothetical protein
VLVKGAEVFEWDGLVSQHVYHPLCYLQMYVFRV